MMDTWIRPSDQLPANGEAVLAVKQLRNGTKDICIARCIHDYKYMDVVTKEYRTGPYWACGGNNNIILWMPMPKIPEEGAEK